ncbi:MAG: Gfo/Idh/MocA family oxidoreductase [Kiritimatiellae bacterium]|nr:Gfo/Idh/MocA family oxidoreductase [Kiritimatiellia bacterium]
MSGTKVAIVGMSNRAVFWALESIKKFKDVQVVALCDPILARCEWADRHHALGGIPHCRGHEELLAKTDFDSVMVMTSDAHHAEVVIPMLQAGKTVFCEKPLEVTAEKCRAIIQADEAAGGKTFVGFNLRYAPTYTIIKEQIESGAVGRLLTIAADEYYDGGRTYFRRWNRFRKESGGLWITKASHDFDILNWVAAVKPQAVQAYAAKTHYVPKPEAGKRCSACKLAPTCPDRARPSIYDDFIKLREQAGGEPSDLCLYNSGSDTFDHGIASIRYEGDLFATYTCNVVAGFSERRIRVSGTRGTLDGTLSTGEVVLTKKDENQIVTIRPKGANSTSHGGADDLVMANFLAFARGEVEPKCRPREAFQSILIGLAANRSGDENRLVQMEELNRR